MAISAVNATGTSNGTSVGASFTVTSPTGTTTGDLIIIAVAERTNTEAVSNVTNLISSAACTKITFTAAATSASLSIWYKFVTGSDGTSWTITNTTNAMAACMAYRGVDTSNPIDATGTSSTTSSNSAAWNSLTFNTANAWLIACFAMNIATTGVISSTAVNVAGSGGSPSLTERVDAGNGGGTNSRQAVGLLDAGYSNSAGQTSSSYTGSLSASNVWSTYTFALREAGAGGGVTVKNLGLLGVG